MSSTETTILVVDDEPVLREVLTACFLDTPSTVVLTAVDGVDALDMLNTNTVDLVITDIRMPRMDGVALVRALASRPTSPRIVLLTADGLIDERELFALGVEALVKKPLKEMDFAGLVTRAKMELQKTWETPPSRTARQALSPKGRATAEDVSLGRGGFCVRYVGTLATGNVSFDCRLPDNTLLKGAGTVRWRNNAERLTGIEFTYLDPCCREHVIAEIDRTQPRSFIPATV
jgi:CheY-like chemotaxis protein